MSRPPADRFADILAAIDRTLTYRSRLGGADGALAEMAYDAVLRNVVVHECFRVDSATVRDIVDNQLVPLAAAIRAHLADEPPPQPGPPA